MDMKDQIVGWVHRIAKAETEKLRSKMQNLLLLAMWMTQSRFSTHISIHKNSCQ